MTRGRLRSGRLLRMLVASIGLAAGSSILLGSDPGAHDDLPPPSDPDSSERVSVSESVTVTAKRTFRDLADLGGSGETALGVANAASEGAVTAAQIDARPVLRPADLLEAVPGLVVSQHSGEGNANQYYLRGFDLDHGTDFSTSVAGIPVLCAVSAPSSLAVAAADRFGQTVVGFLRGSRFNVYTHPDRVDLDA